MPEAHHPAGCYNIRRIERCADGEGRVLVDGISAVRDLESEAGIARYVCAFQTAWDLIESSQAGNQPVMRPSRIMSRPICTTVLKEIEGYQRLGAFS